MITKILRLFAQFISIAMIFLQMSCAIDPANSPDSEESHVNQRLDEVRASQGLELVGHLQNGEYTEAADRLVTLYSDISSGPAAELLFLTEVADVYATMPDDATKHVEFLSTTLPNELVGYYLRSIDLFGKASQARGTKSANKTDPKQIEEMNKLLNQSIEIFEKLLQLDNTDYLAYAGLGAIYSQWGNENQSKKHFRKAIEIRPDSYAVWRDYLHYSKPRWGGSYEQMELLLKEMKQYESDNTRLKGLQGSILDDQALDAQLQSKVAQALSLLYRAAEYGPVSSRYAQMSKLERRSGNFQKACLSIQKANEAWPLSRTFIAQALRCEK